MAKGWVLVIEPNEALRTYLIAALTDDGYTVVAAPGTGTVWVAARSEPPCLVLLNLWLPPNQVESIVHAIKQRFGDDVAVVGMSTQQVPVPRVLDALVVMPCDLEELLNCVEQFAA